MSNSVYVCPQCQSRLSEEKDGYSCSSGCGGKFLIENGVPNFRETEFYWGVLNQEMVSKLVILAQTKGWKKAFEDSVKKENQSLHDYLLDDSRSIWHCILPLLPQSRVLDIGCGWGGITFPLAREYKEVYALDATKENVQFINIRCKQDKITNIFPLCANALKLPFEDNFFDLVVVYGVLEWMGLSGDKERPEFYQRAMLKEIYRVLKKGGCLYLAIENRWGIVYLLGARDPHTGLRFITLLPRFLADIYSKLVRKQPYRAYTHSLTVYKKMFKQAGFPSIDSYAPLPSYRNFWYLLPLDDKKITAYFINYLAAASSPLAVWLFKLAKYSRLYGIIKHIVSDHSFVVKK